MTRPSEGALPKYAVCPRIERGGAERVPKLFTSKAAAERFLKSEVQSGPVELEAQVANLPVEQARALRTARKAQLRKDRKEAEGKVRRGELHWSAFPAHLQALRNEDQGWRDPVPVCGAADYHGPKCNRTLREFLPADAVGPMPALTTDEEIDRALENRSADYTCYLDADWRFDELEADAWRRVGHEYSGRRYGSIGEIVVRAIHDLEAAFHKLHPDAPCAAVAGFWRSWQTQRHIADFCSRLADSDTARLLTGNRFDGAEEAERARVHLYRQLAAFAHELLDETAPSSAADQTANGGGHCPRAAFIAPILDEKGWSILDWANNSGVDFHTANDFLKGNTKPYASTRKKLAGSLGLKVGELPR